MVSFYFEMIRNIILKQNSFESLEKSLCYLSHQPQSVGVSGFLGQHNITPVDTPVCNFATIDFLEWIFIEFCKRILF